MMNKPWEDAAMDLLISERQRIGTVVLPDERGQREAAPRAAVDEVRHRRGRRRSGQRARASRIRARTATFRASWASTCATST